MSEMKMGKKMGGAAKAATTTVEVPVEVPVEMMEMKVDFAVRTSRGDRIVVYPAKGKPTESMAKVIAKFLKEVLEGMEG